MDGIEAQTGPTESHPSRKSGRRRHPSQRLSDFHLLARQEGFDDLEAQSATSLPGPEADATNDDHDFELGEQDQVDLSEDEYADDDVNASDEAEDHDDAGMDDDMDDVIDLEASPNKTEQPSHLSIPNTSANVTHRRPGHGRTSMDNRPSNAKHTLRQTTFGPAKEDQEPAFQAAFRWRREFCVPSRKADLSGAGGYHRSFYHKDADRKREMNEDWKWYDDEGGRNECRIRQEEVPIDEESAYSYMRANALPIKVIAGPVDAQSCYDLPLFTAMLVEHPFNRGNPPAAGDSPRSGFYLNVGGRVQTISWAPNQGSCQYFAVSLMPQGEQLYRKAPHSAFRPQPSVKSAIQIWEIGVDANGYIDARKPVRLRLVICTRFGDIKALRWCPSPRKFEAEDANGKHLGLLAGIWGDGSVRLLDIDVPTTDKPTQYSHILETAFVSRPPDTIFSCLTWLSSRGIAAGTSTGNVAIFDLPASLKRHPAGATSSKPELISIVQSTYITSIQSGYPSRPHMLMTASMSGLLSLTDLTRVSTYPGFHPGNTVYSPRQRVGRIQIAWHDWTQMGLSVDDNRTLQGSPLRRFFSFVGLSKFKSSTVALAISECHPCIAAGGVGGEVTFTNPVPRALSSKEKVWNLRWFLHTWRKQGEPDVRVPSTTAGSAMDLGNPPIGTSAAANNEANASTQVAESQATAENTGKGRDTSNKNDVSGDAADSTTTEVPDASSQAEQRRSRDVGMVDVADDTNAASTGQEKASSAGFVRIVEGFRAENNVSMQQTKGVEPYTTIYEPQTAVTALAWNPNLHVGGWIAAGMASGLVRIEDIGM